MDRPSCIRADRPAAWLLGVLSAILAAGVFAADPFQAKREAMVREIAEQAADAAAETGRAQISPSVLKAMRHVPRHRFVADDDQRFAYQNRPLAIGHGQTISQPFIVALMTDLLRLEPGDRVFELGTGSGYQAAVLAELGVETYSIEIVEPLAQRAAKVLGELYPGKVQTRHGDGYYGWEAHAPFDAVIVTAASSHVPPPLIAQLKPGGRMVIPLGARFMVQQLVLIEKDADGRVRSREIAPVRFVPLTGGH